MIPWLALVGIGRRRRFVLPVPVFLLWPFLALGWVALSVAALFAPRHRQAGRGSSRRASKSGAAARGAAARGAAARGAAARGAPAHERATRGELLQLRASLALMTRLSGLAVDVRAHDGTSFYFRLI